MLMLVEDRYHGFGANAGMKPSLSGWQGRKAGQNDISRMNEGMRYYDDSRLSEF